MSDREPLYLSIGQQIARLRTARGLTQEDLARVLGVSRPNVTMIELGKSRIPVHQLAKLVQTFGVSWEQLTGAPPTARVPETSEQVSTARPLLVRQAIENRARALGLFDAEMFLREKAGEAFAQERDAIARALRRAAQELKEKAEGYVAAANALSEEADATAGDKGQTEP